MAISIPAQLDGFTVADLELVPDDGMRYEVVNGSLFVTPPASYLHNRRAQHIGLALLAAAPPDLAVLMTGTQAVALDDGDGPCPDVLVLAPGEYTLAVPAAAVSLVVDVTSDPAGDRGNDTVTKLERYARAGIPHYWIVDPDRITAYELVPEERRYREVQAGRRVQVTAPFPVEVTLLD